MAHRPPSTRRGLRLADLFALVGALGFLAILIDRVVSGTPGDGNLVYGSVALMLGVPVQRVAEAMLKRGNGAT